MKASDGFCLDNEMAKLEQAKSDRLKASQAASVGLCTELENIFAGIRNQAWAGYDANDPQKNIKQVNFPKLDYYTDKKFHESLNDTGIDYRVSDWTKHCGCPEVHEISKWVRAG